MNDNPGKGMGVAALVLGVVGLCTGWFYGVGCICGIIGVVLAVKSTNTSQAAGFPTSGLATAGLVCSIIAIVVGAGCLICTICAAGSASASAAGCAGLADSLSNM